jgi:hypothetical protein
MRRLLAAWPGEIPLHIRSEHSGEVWMTAWDTTPEDVDTFAAAVAGALDAGA